MPHLFFWLPMALGLSALWLWLNNSLNLSQALLGFAISAVLMRLSLRLRPNLAYPRKPLRMLQLSALVLWDVLQSNWQVARLILRWRDNDFNSGYVYIPLSIRDPHALAFLACIITLSPGTVWSGLTEKDYVLRLHVLDLRDESEWFHIVKHKYERLLLEIFE